MNKESVTSMQNEAPCAMNGSHDATGDNFQYDGDGALFSEAPRPLMRDHPKAQDFPIEALPPFFRESVLAISDMAQTDPAIAAQSVLAVATQAVQPLADIVLPRVGPVPVSNFFLTIAESGERKTTVSGKASEPIKRRERELSEKHKADMEFYLADLEAHKQAALNVKSASKSKKPAEIRTELLALGSEPKKPLSPYLTSSDPTQEALTKNWPDCHPALGIANSEGGSFLGGHGFTAEKTLATGAVLSSLWSGETIRRNRATDGITNLEGRRLTMDLMIQPDAAISTYSNRILRDQGLLARILPVWPESRIGTRMISELSPESVPAYERYAAHILDIFRINYRTTDDGRGALVQHRLEFAAEAAQLWIEFSNHTEKQMAPGGEYVEIRGLASKLPEHAGRLAAVIEVVGNFDDRMPAAVSAESLACGVDLVQHYASEAMRLFVAGKVSPDLDLAAKVWRWIEHRWQEPFISLPDIYQLGPVREIREQNKALHIASVLSEHGYLRKMKRGANVGGKHRRDAWAIYGKLPGSKAAA